MPWTFGYAMTMRRAQGSTLDAVGLWFDHSFPPTRGYAYVASSRVRNATDLFLSGKLRRTDWLPVGPDEEGQRLRRSTRSESSGSEDCSDSEFDPSDSEFGDENLELCDASSAARTESDLRSGARSDADMGWGCDFESEGEYPDCDLAGFAQA